MAICYILRILPNNWTFLLRKPRTFKLWGIISRKWYFFRATSYPFGINFLNQAGDQTGSVVAQGLVRKTHRICLFRNKE